MILVGVDVWARFFHSPADIEPAPVDRPLEDVAAATVRFDPDSLPQGWVVVGAALETALNNFTLNEHPARSAFALGPYRFHVIDTDLGLRAAIHTGWNVARDQLVSYSRQLARVQANEFGRPPGDPAMMIFTPLPRGVRPARRRYRDSLLVKADLDSSYQIPIRSPIVFGLDPGPHNKIH